MALAAKKTVNNKTQTQGKSLHFYFCREMEFRTYFVYFYTFSYKFKVQRTPTEFGLPVPRLACDHALSLYLCNPFSRGWHDTIFSRITHTIRP